MFRILMNDSVSIKPKFITRSAFQNILHLALVADGTRACIGLLGSGSAGQIQTIHLVRSAEELTRKLTSWQRENINCVGLFHLERETPATYLKDIMPELYIDASVNLDEKGRLDVLAYQVSKATNQKQHLSLDMIEDGHSDLDE